MKTVLSYGGGVNSTAILALMQSGEIAKADYAVFADTGAEKASTYNYLEYIKSVSPIPIVVVKSKEGKLWNYCKERNILPMRYLRWCTDRWKKKPISDYLKDKQVKEELIGIDYGEKRRITRWQNSEGFRFPLIELQMNRADCVKAIKAVDWEVPEKSGCVFCPFANKSEFAELKVKEPERFKELCEIEKKTLARLPEMRAKGWFDERYSLDELVSRKFPATDKEQTNLCMYCMS